MANNSSGGAFNKFLNFIGFVDEEIVDDFDDPGFDDDAGRSYNPSGRRQQQEGRPVRTSANYAGQDRYTPSGQMERNQRPPASQARPNYDENRTGAYRYQQDGSNPYMTARPSAAGAQGRQPGKYASPQKDMPARTARNPYPDRERGYSGDEFSSPPKGAVRGQQSALSTDRQKSNVVNMHADLKPQTVIYYLHSLEQCRNVINDLIDNKTILLNLEDMDERFLQRGIDMLAGAAFALNANLRKASNRTYLIAPNSVEIAQTNDIERRY